MMSTNSAIVRRALSRPPCYLVITGMPRCASASRSRTTDTR